MLEKLAKAIIPKIDNNQSTSSTNAISLNGVGKISNAHINNATNNISTSETQWPFITKILGLGMLIPGIWIKPNIHSKTSSTTNISAIH